MLLRPTSTSLGRVTLAARNLCHVTRAPLLRRTPLPPPLATRALCSAAAATTPVAAASPPPATSPPVPATRFAVIALSGAQHKVAVDDLICVEKVGIPVGATLEARRVLMVGEAQATLIGSPLITDAVVRATVEEQGYGKKVVVFKKKRRKGYRRWRGYRSRLTLLRITEIELPAQLEAQMAGGDG